MESLFDQAARAFLDRRNLCAVLALEWTSVEPAGRARAADVLQRLLRHNRRACHTIPWARGWGSAEECSHPLNAPVRSLGSGFRRHEACVDPVATALLQGGPAAHGQVLGRNPTPLVPQIRG